MKTYVVYATQLLRWCPILCQSRIVECGLLGFAFGIGFDLKSALYRVASFTQKWQEKTLKKLW